MGISGEWNMAPCGRRRGDAAADGSRADVLNGHVPDAVRVSASVQPRDSQWAR
jgi:hypothetical protein